MANVTFGMNFGQNTADPELVVEGATSSNDVYVTINLTNQAAVGGATIPGAIGSAGRGEIRRMVENILNFINDGRNATFLGL